MENVSLLPFVDRFDWTYAEHPDIPEPLYIAATIYMLLVGSFGIIGNGAILIAFFKGPAQVRPFFSFCHLPFLTGILIFSILHLDITWMRVTASYLYEGRVATTKVRLLLVKLLACK